MRLSDEDCERLRVSFRAVASDSPAAAAIFYGHLFEMAPHLRRLFVTDMGRQGAKLMSTLGLVVAQIQEWPICAALVEELALRHVAYGVRPEDYEITGRALQRMLGDVLGSDFTPEVALAWERAYGELSGFMTAVAYPAPQC